MSSGSSGLSSQISALRITTKVEQDAAAVLAAAKLQPSLPVVANRIGTGKKGNVPITTNMYAIKTSNIPVYRYDVKMTASLKKKDSSIKLVDLTKKTRGDSVTVDRRDRCRDIFLVFTKTQSNFIRDAKCVYFDLQSILYSLDKFDVLSLGKKFSVPLTDLPSVFEGFNSVEVEIKPVTSEFELSLGDMSGLSHDLSQVSTCLAQFLDIATSQDVMFSPKDHISLTSHTSFFYDHTKHGFREDDSAYFEDTGSYLAIGSEKSIRMIEGLQPNKGSSTALIVESKKTPFHVVESVLTKASRMVRDINNIKNGDAAKLDASLSNLRVETKHLGRYQRFDIRGIDNKSARERLVPIDGEKMSVEQYFKKKYNITLVAPNAPLIKARGKDNTISYVPIELCVLCDNQRLKTNQQTARMVQMMIRKCAVPPCVLQEQIQNTFRALDLGNSEYLKKAGIQVSQQPLSVMGRSLQAPNLDFKGASVSVNPNNGTWQGKNYLIPANCSKWFACGFLGPRDRINDKDFRNFLNRFVADANGKGMRIAPPKMALFGADLREVDKNIKQAANDGFEFFFAIHSDTADEVHNSIKFAEQNYGIVTQALRYGTFMNMATKGQPMTLANIINKTNVKLGGLNYSLSFNSPGTKEVLGDNTLYIGFGINHPGGGLGMDNDAEDKSAASKGKIPAPSIIGYSANYGLAHEFEFVGDFICQPPLRDEKVDIIQMVINRCVKKYRTNRKAEPKRIMVFRNGCSEGQFQQVLKYEVPLINLALKEAKCHAKLTIVVPNKLQSVRFFNSNMNPRDRPADQNIKPGLVIDQNVVHPIFAEFYLNSHRALQGTAKTPKYTLIYDDNEMQLEAIERITYFLCYGHQIVFMPTSLPSPVYIANRYAERGRKLYQSWIGSTARDHSGVDYPQMTETLGYFGHKSLENRRINA